MAKGKSSCEARVECGVDEWIGDGRVIMLPGGSMILKCNEKGFRIGNERDLDLSFPAVNILFHQSL